MRETPVDREIVSTRVFGAPREQLFQAFSDPSLLARWWGPNGFTHTFQAFDLRPGGAWRFVMYGPDGADYPVENEFLEVVRPERIVFLHPDPGHTFRMSLLYSEEGGGTRLTWRMLFESAADYEPVKDIIPAINEQNFDRLEALLVGLE